MLLRQFAKAAPALVLHAQLPLPYLKISGWGFCRARPVMSLASSSIPGGYPGKPVIDYLPRIDIFIQTRHKSPAGIGL